MSQQLNCKAVLSFPAVFDHLVIKFSEEQQKAFLLHLSQSFPDTKIHGEVKQTLSHLFFKHKRTQLFGENRDNARRCFQYHLRHGHCTNDVAR
jgi:hypothetical protein